MPHTIGSRNAIKVSKVIEDVQRTNDRINLINKLSNLSIELNALYLKTGFIRDRKEFNRTKKILETGLPEYKEEHLSINEKFHLYELFVNYNFFIQDFRKALDYAQKWVDLFEKQPNLIQIQLEMYIRALNSLMIAQYRLYHYIPFLRTKRKMKMIRTLPVIINENIERKLLKYTYAHEFNGYFMMGFFSKGVALIDKVKPAIESFIVELDNHSKVILYYKLACLYFGDGKFNESIFWLNKIFNEQDSDLREDIHSFARILNLISHYEIGNYDVVDYYIRSTYRFLLKKEDLHKFQVSILGFLKRLGPFPTEQELISYFSTLLVQLKELEKDPYEARAFIYFDIISWLESKIQGKPVREIIHGKAIERIAKGA